MKRKSTVRFWISQILQNVGMIGVVALILEVFALVGSAGEIEGGYIWFFLSMLPMYIVLAAAFWVFIYILGFFKTYYPVVLSFRAHRGKTHRNFIFCLLTIDALMFVILAVVFAALFHMQVMDALLACSLITGVMLFFEGIGLAFSVLYVRYGKLGVAICALVGAAFGGVFGYVMASGGDAFYWLVGHIFSWISAGILFAAGICVFAAGIVVMHLVFRKAQLYI